LKIKRYTISCFQVDIWKVLLSVVS
jgi:hypothetical protein